MSEESVPQIIVSTDDMSAATQKLDEETVQKNEQLKTLN